MTDSRSKMAITRWCLSHAIEPWRSVNGFSANDVSVFSEPPTRLGRLLAVFSPPLHTAYALSPELPAAPYPLQALSSEPLASPHSAVHRCSEKETFGERAQCYSPRAAPVLGEACEFQQLLALTCKLEAMEALHSHTSLHPHKSQVRSCLFNKR